MKSSPLPLSLLAAAALLGSIPVASAQTVTVDLQPGTDQPSGLFIDTVFNGNPFTSPALAFNVTITEVESVPVVNPLTWIGFCIELSQGVDTGSGLTYQLSSLAGALPADSALRAARIAWLMDNHAPSAQASGWSHTTTTPLSLAMQLAVWEVVADTDLSLTGASTGFNVGPQVDPTLANARSLAETWLTGLAGAGVNSSYVSQNYLIDALKSPDDQDLLYLRPIPEPSSALLFAAGSLVLFRRRRA